MQTAAPTCVVYDGTAAIDYLTFAIEHRPPSAPATLGQLAEMAIAAGWRYVWLAPSPSWAAFKNRAFWEQTANTAGADLAVSGTRREHLAALVSRGGKVVCRVMRIDDSRWGIGEVSGAGAALALGELHQLLGWHAVLSPAVTGLNLLKADLSPRGWLPEPVSWAPHSFTTLDIQFLRRDLPARDFEYMHTVDRNGAYLAAARSADFGTSGAVTYTTYEPLWEQIRGFGVAEVRVRSIPPAMAHLVPLKAARKATQFIALPVLALLRAANADFEFVSLTRFQHTHRALRGWAETLVSTRIAVFPGARKAGKAIAVQSIGMMDYQYQGALAPWYFRPDWRAHIVGTNALTFARMISRLEADGMPVLAAYTDSLSFLSYSPDPPDYLTEHASSVGGYKRVSSYNREQTCRAVRMAQGEDLRITDWLEAIKYV